jgi:AcrR family transcriptional regulator
MAKIKTRDLILDVALVLFNDEGEPLVTSVDLANEMNISPGNLYYHFKGKEEVVEELYARFHAGLSYLMDDIQGTEELDEDAMLLYLGVITDFLSEYKFISQNIASICVRYEVLRKPIVQSMSRLHRQLKEFAETLLDSKDSDSSLPVATLLADNLLNTLLNLPGSFDIINGGDEVDIREHLYLQMLPFLPA